jgi:ribonucleoside-diphosphate reductase alpha chain
MGMRVYSHEEALKSCLEYFNGDQLASDVFISKYALRNKENELLELNPDMMHRRLAKEFARIEANYPNGLTENEIYELMKGFKYIVPQGSPMSGIGNEYKIQSLSNCFVIPSPEDSYGSILLTDQEMVGLMMRRGGVGFDISNIRPKGLPTSNAAGTTDGIGVFMERYSNTTREVAQGGRRGALMETIDINHPEIETFINIKRDRKRVTGANISIKISDKFMNAVENDDYFELKWPVKSNNPVISNKIKARKIWDQIVDSAWTSAEPGVLFWDTMQRESPPDCYKEFGFETISTNPCSEIGLSANYDACRLLLLNASSYVVHPFTDKSYFDFELFQKHVILAQRLMDDLVDLEIEMISKILNKINSDPESERSKRVARELWENVIKTGQIGRRTGLGLTGIGDAVAMLNVVYGSQTSVDVVESIYRNLAVATELSSTILAEERGTFSIFNYELEKNNPYLNRVADASPEFKNRWQQFGRRNISTTTTAPCGSVSLLSQTTSGIEPAFLLSYKRRKKINTNDITATVDFVDALGDKWQEYVVYHHGVKQWMDITGETNIELSPYYGATSNDVDWEMSVKLQAAAQKYISHSISKTCNLPNNATKELVDAVYRLAWKTGCKGITVYRDGSRDGVLVSNDSKKDEKKQTTPTNFQQHSAPKRPITLPCDIHQVRINGEAWTVLMGLYEGKPYEIFAGLSKYVELPKKIKTGTLVKNGKKDGIVTYNLVVGQGDDAVTLKDIVSLFDNSTNTAFTRTISLSLRHGAPVQYVAEQLLKDKTSDMQSFSRVISRVLKNYIENGAKPSGGQKCPDCGSDKLMYSEGCISCVCGWTKCS